MNDEIQLTLFNLDNACLNKEDLINKVAVLFNGIENLNTDEKIQTINEIRKELSRHSPFNQEPVDCVLWVKNENVIANDYNPNSVAPPEMELLRVSINEDGYTQPIVTFSRDGLNEVVDGFHRHRVGKEIEEIRSRIHGYLPVVEINANKTDKSDRMASTIRHNRARGKHKVQAMSEIVLDLRKRNWNNEKIAKNLGMESDEVLRLSQIGGLAEMFADKDFSEAWEVDLDESGSEIVIEN